MHIINIIIQIFFLLYVQTALCTEIDLQSHKKGIWSIQGTAGKKMWIVIHNLKQAKETDIYHIEVLARNLNEPAWKIDHVVKHMAITKSALVSSVLKPLNNGAVYPESFETAFNNWKTKNSGNGGYICTTSIYDCMTTQFKYKQP